MRRRLDREDLEAAIVGGLLLSAGGSGGSGIVRNRATGEMALTFSGVDLVDATEFADDALVVVSTGVGAPATTRPRIEPRHAIESARLLLHTIGKPVAAVMPAHVPGLNAWLQASVLGIDLIDVASNGRGHPTIKMGAMGLASRPDISILQAGVGGRRHETRLSLVVEGDLVMTSNIMRAAALENGGLILATRGPLTAQYVRQYGATGAISHQLGLGRAMLAAGNAGDQRIDAALKFLKATLLVIGKVIENAVAFNGDFDVGWISVEGKGGVLRLGVCNEYMCAERDGERLRTFPDLIASLDPRSGLALEVSELTPTTEVAIVATTKDNLPLGAGVLDPTVYEEIERAMGTRLAAYALAPGKLTTNHPERISE